MKDQVDKAIDTLVDAKYQTSEYQSGTEEAKKSALEKMALVKNRATEIAQEIVIQEDAFKEGDLTPFTAEMQYRLDDFNKELRSLTVRLEQLQDE